jgi:hypothetical protein
MKLCLDAAAMQVRREGDLIKLARQAARLLRDRDRERRRSDTPSNSMSPSRKAAANDVRIPISSSSAGFAASIIFSRHWSVIELPFKKISAQVTRKPLTNRSG